MPLFSKKKSEANLKAKKSSSDLKNQPEKKALTTVTPKRNKQQRVCYAVLFVVFHDQDRNTTMCARVCLQNDISQLLFCALRTVFRKAIAGELYKNCKNTCEHALCFYLLVAISGGSRVAIQSFLRGIFSPLTENNTDFVSLDNFRRFVDHS